MQTSEQPARFDVIGFGNAIVDVIAEVDERLLERLDLAKGTMTLVERERMAGLYARIGPAVEMSGGSCANSMAALAALGARVAYVGKVQDDQLGEVFRHDIRASGVAFRTAPLQGGPPTARCLVLVTPDAQRTMATYLGACVELGPVDVDETEVGAAPDRLPRRLSVGPPGRQGRLPQSRCGRASPRPPGRADPVRSVLRRSLARRVPRAHRRPRRHPDRQRGRGLWPVSGRPARPGDRAGAGRGRDRRADLQRRGLGAGVRRRPPSGSRRRRSPAWSTPPARAISTPRACCTG